MAKRHPDRSKIEFGDFQTPPDLAAAVCRLLAARGLAPRTLVEPTCGTGNLLLAALDALPSVRHVHALDVNPTYVDHVRDRLAARRTPATLTCASFFDHDWPAHIAGMPTPILFVGNPPWVTSADLGHLGSTNLPIKKNTANLPGIAALTGKSNFDISQWIFNSLLRWLADRPATISMLCKTSVARKALATAWDADVPIRAASMHRIDSAKFFAAAVDACLLTVDLGARGPATCPVYPDLESTAPTQTPGRRDGQLVADTTLHDRWHALQGASHRPWRSGIKHDCAAVMEFTRIDDHTYSNGDGERVDLEPRYLYPLLKSSDLAREDPTPRRWLLVPQSHTSDDPLIIKTTAPKTWRYLQRHKPRLDRRASAIYRGKPPFSVFGVGDYTFAPWKIATSGLYKTLRFTALGPHAGKPVVLDDTCYSLACSSEAEARLLARMLASPAAQEFYNAFIFWDAKRPITAELLRRLDLHRLAAHLALTREFNYLSLDPAPPTSPARPALQ